MEVGSTTYLTYLALGSPEASRHLGGVSFAVTLQLCSSCEINVEMTLRKGACGRLHLIELGQFWDSSRMANGLATVIFSAETVMMLCPSHHGPRLMTIPE